MADNFVASLLAPLSRWARRRSRVGIAVVGALPGLDAAPWAVPRHLPLGQPTDATAPRQADLLVVVGRISHKLSPFLVRTHAAMAQPSTVLVIDLEPAATAGLYPTVTDVARILPVDAVVRSPAPSAALLARALAALDERLPGVAR
ncbi:MAG: hypothetical protein HYS27_02190 [Deltaproteobacteria bacterium]|nr:hypothetical protein [Deltaproteobacteria bacterium]